MLIHGESADCRSLGRPHVLVIIPSHNALASVKACIASIKRSGGAYKYHCLVIADHCDDGTESHEFGECVSVVSRRTGVPGKSHALAWLFDYIIKPTEYDAFIITDSTATICCNSLDRLVTVILSGFLVAVGRATISNPSQAPWYVSLHGLALAHRGIQNKARSRMGISSLIEGRLMAYSTRYISMYRWTLARPPSASDLPHPTEDWRHGINLARNQIHVSYVHDAIVQTPLRGDLSQVNSQALRWSGGRILSIKYGCSVLAGTIKYNNWRFILAHLDGLIPPLSILVIFICTAATVLLFHGYLYIFVVIMALMSSYFVALVRISLIDGIRLSQLLRLPQYVLMRVSIIIRSAIDQGFK